MIIATISKPAGKMTRPSTPMTGAGSLIAYGPGLDGKPEMTEAVTVHAHYSARGNGMQPVRACVWVRMPRGSGRDWLSGSGAAGGCGYHKESAAIAAAVSAAGVELTGAHNGSRESADDENRRFSFDGAGSSYYPEVFEAIATAAGFTGPMLWVSHGL